jgi:DNA-binding CsgD family transcriptional regulator
MEVVPDSVSTAASPLTRDPTVRPDGDVLEQARVISGLLQELAMPDGFVMTALDPLSGSHRQVVLASAGYSPALLEEAVDRFLSENPVVALIHSREPRVLRWHEWARDWNLNFSDTRIAQEFLLPSGFRDGSTTSLRLPDGRYTGVLGVSWSSPTAATDERRDMIERLRPALAVVCDLLRGAQAVAEAIVPDAHAVIVSRRGVVSDLPGRDPGPHLGAGGGLRQYLIRSSSTPAPQRFLWIDPQGDYHGVQRIRCRGDAVLVAEQTIEPPAGLTRRELEILHLVAIGDSNVQAANRLVVSRRTVATHVEHLLAKLGCTSRAQLAARAVADGLLLAEVPAEPYGTVPSGAGSRVAR